MANVLDLARDAEEIDATASFTTGIPSTGRMAAGAFNHALQVWDRDRKHAQVRNALSTWRKVTPTYVLANADVTEIANSRAGLEWNNCLFHSRVHGTTTNEAIVKIDLLTGVESLFVTAFDPGNTWVTADVTKYSGAVGDGQLYFSNNGLSRMLVFDPVTATFSYISSSVARFFLPGLGAQDYTYVKFPGGNATIVTTDTIGSAETTLDLFEGSDGNPVYISGLNPVDQPYVSASSLGKMVLTSSGLSLTDGVRKTVVHLNPELPTIYNVFAWKDRFLLDTSDNTTIVADDHRADSYTTFDFVADLSFASDARLKGARNDVAYVTQDDGLGTSTDKISFSTDLVTWEHIRPLPATSYWMKARRMWTAIGADLYYSGVLP